MKPAKFQILVRSGAVRCIPVYRCRPSRLGRSTPFRIATVFARLTLQFGFQVRVVGVFCGQLLRVVGFSEQRNSKNVPVMFRFVQFSPEQWFPMANVCQFHKP